VETQPTRFCIAHVCSRYIHTYAIAVQHQSKIIKLPPSRSLARSPTAAQAAARPSAAHGSRRVTVRECTVSAPRAHKSAAWVAWAAHFFSRSSTSLARKLLPTAFQHRQQQGHGRQRSGEHHLVS